VRAEHSAWPPAANTELDNHDAATRLHEHSNAKNVTIPSPDHGVKPLDVAQLGSQGSREA
jgi:hypothetical protein